MTPSRPFHRASSKRENNFRLITCLLSKCTSRIDESSKLEGKFSLPTNQPKNAKWQRAFSRNYFKTCSLVFGKQKFRPNDCRLFDYWRFNRCNISIIPFCYDIKASSDRAIFPFETSLKSFDLSLLAVLQACTFLWAFNLNVKNAQNFISWKMWRCFQLKEIFS